MKAASIQENTVSISVPRHSLQNFWIFFSTRDKDASMTLSRSIFKSNRFINILKPSWFYKTISANLIEVMEKLFNIYFENAPAQFSAFIAHE